MDDLLALDACRPSPHGTLPYPLADFTAPLPVAAWSRYLGDHPDRKFSAYIIKGLSSGFRIGFDRTHSTRSSRRNTKSAIENKAVVDNYTLHEVELGRLIRLPPAFPLTHPVHLSTFGVIPKKGCPNKWRLIVDLSSPDGASVNDGISSALTSIHYSSVDDAVQRIQELGSGTRMAKLDLKSAYRLVPVHPDDRLLLCTLWGDAVYMDTALPFGLSSAPKIFSAVADALLWVMQGKGAKWVLHYLDDFILFGRPLLQECHSALDTSLQASSELGWEANKIDS